MGREQRKQNNQLRTMNLSDLNKMAMEKPWVTPGETAAILEVSRQRVTELLDEGKLEFIRFLGTRHVFLHSIIQRKEKLCKNPINTGEALQ
jgi:excisionase family DNA binding protein